ncbi:hypothetical protein A0H81_01049 [Grifola frondosa]|uniref:Uncharacterized protein n=1 Tax=Grifola frondosa TaxID=5627 RepID=A0A1C7MTF5_GRIFR|nr:hypothetical protein A0H81_01049 [Grifola frondosa]
MAHSYQVFASKSFSLISDHLKGLEVHWNKVVGLSPDSLELVPFVCSTVFMTEIFAGTTATVFLGAK